MFFGAIAVAFIIFFIGKWFLKETYDGTKEMVGNGYLYMYPFLIIGVFVYCSRESTLSLPELVAGLFSIMTVVEGIRGKLGNIFCGIVFPIVFYYFHIHIGVNGLLSCFFSFCAWIIALIISVWDGPEKSESSTVVSDKVK